MGLKCPVKFFDDPKYISHLKYAMNINKIEINIYFQLIKRDYMKIK